MIPRARCQGASIVTWRTPNQYWFVAVCQDCGRSATSMVDGGVAIQRVVVAHDKDEQQK